VEKIGAIVTLNRIREKVDERLLQGQNGFRPLKSCRDAVFRVWRGLEESNRKGESFVLCFVDYSKAFDSLIWGRLWKCLEFAGCPVELIAVIRGFYDRSTVSLRLSSDGKAAPPFAQRKGIRQGSSLSPCIFVLAMDFCLRVFEHACTKLGMTPRADLWTAYADDLADKTQNEAEASAALQQLEAASAFIGLMLNVPKTEAMGCRVKAAVDAAPEAKATAERVAVKFLNGWFEGWMADARWTRLLGVQRDPPEPADGWQAILFDDGDGMHCRIQGGGWLRDQDEDAHRMRRLGFDKPLVEGEAVVCEECGSMFTDNRALRQHRASRFCRRREEMTVAQQRALRKTRRTELKRRGELPETFEDIRVVTCSGEPAKATGKFTYLGSLLSPAATATPEVRRRIAMATATFGGLSKLWKSSGVTRKTKAALYSSLVLTTMLYNGEVWPVKPSDVAALEGAHLRMQRSMFCADAHDAHISREQLVQAFPSLCPIHILLSQKRLRWVGHALRRSDGDRSKRAVLEEFDVATSPWTALLRADCRLLPDNPSPADLSALSADPCLFRSSTCVQVLSRTIALR
jgi:hypothetical protein